MSTEDNKALLRHFYEEVFNQKHIAAIDQFIDPNQVDHSAPPGTPGGIEGTRQLIGMYLTAFPDHQVTVEDMIAEGDKVVARIKGRFWAFPPLASTGRSRPLISSASRAASSSSTGITMTPWV